MSGQQKVRLTEVEKREYGEKIGQLLKELSVTKTSRKIAVKEFGVQIESLENRIYDLREALRHGYEWRDAPALPFTEQETG